ncbi:MAG: class I SAM-dependent methyltransferase [Oliverpabstia sp.]
MIGAHPGGIALTKRLLSLAGVKPPGAILDLGAGSGKSVRYLQELGFNAVGIDLEPKGEGVEQQNMEKLSFSADTFEYCISECSISCSYDGSKALEEAYRVLKPGGSFLISDVFFGQEDAPHLSMKEPLTWKCWEKAFVGVGFQICALIDETCLWREFFLESLWNGNADDNCVDFYIEAGRAKCGYFLAWLRKGAENGFI